MKAITTKFLPDKRQYRAWDQDRNFVEVPEPDQFMDTNGVPAGHRQAALALIRKMGWGPTGIQSGSINEGWVHVLLSKREPQFPRYFRSVAHPSSNAICFRFDSRTRGFVMTAKGDRPPNNEWTYIDMLISCDEGSAFEITKTDAEMMVAEVKSGGDPWRKTQ